MSAVHTVHRKQLPAYGRELLELRQRGLVPRPGFMFAHVIICLDSWRWAKQHTRVVVPEDADPSALDFTMVAGLNVLLVYQTTRTLIARRDALITAMLKYLPAELVVFDMDAPHESFVVKSSARGLEREEYAA